ncbi:glycosyltransferase family protein [Ideonella oryzae]|uniref:Glycosyltransferase n=1 Tax=Ideonella oryzae TaxID=2937441 RepID=A0ABT1BSY3_9BURK|nr:glycosyltransferase [Ideonella oryzae]
MSRPLAIAFLACNKNPDRFREDPSFTYRCENLALALAAQGHEVTLAHLSRPGWGRRPDIVVFHRPLLSWRFWWTQRRLRRQGVRLLADVDDLVFDPALAGQSPAVLNGQLPLRALQRRFWRHQQALRLFDRITVSTQALAQALAAQPGPGGADRIFWLPNAVHRRWRTEAEPEVAPCAEPVLRYLPGTHSHDRDFALVAPVLSALLRKRPGLRLELVGPLSFVLDAPPGQVQHRPRLPFADYLAEARRPGIHLAPLEATPFTACKSALKVIEAAFWNQPTVCSPLPDAARFTDTGACVATSAEDWRHWITRLLDEPAVYRAITHGLRSRVLRHADIDHQALAWLEAMRPRAEHA